LVLVLRPNDCAERLSAIDSLNQIWRAGRMDVAAVMLVSDSNASDWYRLGASAGIQFPLHLGDPVAWQRALNLLTIPATPFVIAYDRTGAVRAVLPGGQVGVTRLSTILDNHPSPASEQ
jgi:hypothetical protein